MDDTETIEPSARRKRGRPPSTGEPKSPAVGCARLRLECGLLTLPEAAGIFDDYLSTAWVMARDGRLETVKVAGRRLAKGPSVKRLIDGK